jgi:LysR family hydrogen peroxide-inducible transcriptional activator
MTLTQLEYLVAVDTHRHFGKAAKASHVTQPTLSMQLQKLEDELGVILFDRSKSPVIPTTEGERIIEQARVILREQSRLLELAQRTKDELAGDFRLAVIPTLSTYVLPLFLRSFARRYPSVNLVIEEARTDEIWLLDKGNCFRDQVLSICSESPLAHTPGSNLRFESGNLETLKNMVLTSSGYTILPHLAVAQLTGARRKLVRPFRAPVPTREVSLVHERTVLGARVIDALQTEIERSLPDEIRSLDRRKVAVTEFEVSA